MSGALRHESLSIVAASAVQWLSILCGVVIGFFIGEKLITGAFLVHALEGYYWAYEFIFFFVLVLGYGYARTVWRSWPSRLLIGVVISYFSSFLGYHMYAILSRSLAGWLTAIETYPVLIGFAPSCIVGTIVGVIYVLVLEIIAGTAKKYLESHCVIKGQSK